MRPYRIDPFGYRPNRGVCEAIADTIVARNLLRMIAAGAAAHGDHAREVVLILKLAEEVEFLGGCVFDLPPDSKVSKFKSYYKRYISIG